MSNLAEGATIEPGHASDDPSRRDFIHIAAITAAAGGAAAVVWPFIDQMNPSSAALAMGTIEIDLTAIQPGQQIVYKWRGQPLFVRRRTPKEIAESKAVDVASLPDPVAPQAVRSSTLRRTWRSSSATTSSPSSTGRRALSRR